MITAYKIILRPDKIGYTVYVPDFDRSSQGKTIGDAIYMARDLIGILGISLQDMGKGIPSPGTVEYQKKKTEIETYVDIDFADYRKKHDKRRIKKTLSIPSWLNQAAESEKINFSRTLEEALLNKLNR